MDVLEGLNPEQRSAVLHDGGPLLVVAGAGTGKTQVITHRIAYLIKQGKAKPGEVLALTFTEKAAREMEERLYELIGWQSFQVPVMTFHAFGTELLGRFASHIGRSVRGGLLNDTQKALLLKQHINEISFSYYGPQADMFEFLVGIVRYIGELQNAAVSIQQYQSFVDGLKRQSGDLHPRDVDEQVDLAALYRLYESIKEQTGTFDYNDQLQIPLNILRERPNLADRLGNEYRYVLVDEYQDTNRVQDELIRAFVGPRGNIFAVGDDDQAIYGFRGADIGNILDFGKHFELKKPAVLVRNYRSGQAILDASYSLIRNNDPERLETKLGIDKHLIALHNESTTSYQAYSTPADEVSGVVAEIAKRISAGEQPSDIAVLASTHAPLKAVAKAMRALELPFALSTSINIFEQPELIGLWYLMKWLCFQANDEAIGHVIMGPMVKWTPDQYRPILERARKQLITVEESLRMDSGREAKELVKRVDEWRGWAQGLHVSQLAFKLVFDTGRADEWRERAESSGRMIRVFGDLQRLYEQMQDFETISSNPTLAGYADTFPTPPALEVSEPAGDARGVQLLTVHASKGLEFETVYIIACTQRGWSGVRSAARQVPEALLGSTKLPPEHEYRRLMYVAVTRARRSLVVSSPIKGAGGGKQPPTPFVGELFGASALKEAPMGVSAGRFEEVMSKLQRFYPMQGENGHKLLPFETSDGWLELSVTQLGGYEYCPFEFYLQYVLQIKQPIGPQLAFGNALHKVFEAYYKASLRDTPLVNDELHSLLDEQWSDRGYERRELADADRALAHRTLDGFIAREGQSDRKVIGSEVPIRLDLPEAKLRLKGKIDALYEGSEGVELRDFKTGRTKTNKEKLDDEAKRNFQLRTYALAYQRLNGNAPAQLVLDYVVTGVEGSAALSPAILRNHTDKLVDMAHKIRAGDFAPNPSPVHNCAAIRYYGTGEQDELVEESMRNVEETV
jgi:DNA helicase II / ATP-dependent DNA helicase PcrA